MLIPAKSVTLKNNLTVVLRSPNSEEAESLLSHLKIIFNESYRNMNQPKEYWDNFSVEKEKEILADFAQSKDKFMISVFSSDRIVGNLGFFGMGAGFLKHNGRIGMGLNKEFHNLGLGSALLNYAFESAKQAGFSRAELTVRTFNEPGIKLYEKTGFRRVGVLKDTAFIDGEYWDEYMYERAL